MQIFVYKTESMIKKNVGKRIENEKSQVFLKIFKLEIIAENITSIMIFKDIPNTN